MPRFFFDVSDGRCATDETGVDFADDKAARREVIRRAAMLIKATKTQPDNPKNWRLDVKDNAGAVVFWIDARLGIMLASN